MWYHVEHVDAGYLKAEVFKWHSKRQGAVWISHLWEKQSSTVLSWPLDWVTLTLNDWKNKLKNTHIVLIANVDVWDLDLQVLDDLSGQLLHKRVLLLQSWIICADRHSYEPSETRLAIAAFQNPRLPKNSSQNKSFPRSLMTCVQCISWKTLG